MEPLEADDPRQVGRFEILARLGAGGMGRVYLARLPTGEQFALKMIHQFLSDDVQFRRRFHREVMAAQRVTGENTAALVDADPDARPPWMAVEFVDGPTLSELVEQGGPLTVPSSARLASGMAAALISIHSAGLVHRDLKPSNVLMGATGARLIDFGIAQASGASSLTMTGLITGSAGFMSPEQAQAEHVTEASDVFALGTVLYFAATGHRPFGEGSPISVTYRVVHADPDLSGIRDDGLRELIANCLMKDPSLRPTPQEIYERCPGIADGSWSAHRVGEVTTTTLSVGQPSQETTRVHSPMQLGPPSRITPSPSTALPTRREIRTNSGSHAVIRPGSGRDGRLDTLRYYASRSWLAIPVGAAVLLAGGTVLALLLSAESPVTPGAEFPTVTEAPIDAAGPTSSDDAPIGPVTPSIIVVPSQPGTTARPAVAATTTAASTPTATPTVSTVPTKTAVPTKPDEPDPDPDPTTVPPVVVPPTGTKPPPGTSTSNPTPSEVEP